MKAVVAAAVAASAALVSLPAAAQMNMSAFYVGASVGQSKFKGACEGLIAGVSCDEKDTAWRILGGYQFTPNIAAEVGYHNFGKTSASSGGVSASVKANAWELVGVGMFPIATQFGIYGKLGGYHGEATLDSNVGVSGKDTNNGWTFGGGLQWDVMPQLGLRGEWQRYRDLGGDNAGKGDIDVFSIGALWRFR